jgi:hypothetical protein
MTTAMHRYTLDNITSILFAGFDYQLPNEVLENISNLALQVGSPDYVKTPVFQKRENPLKSDVAPKDTIGYKKNKRSKGHEITNDDDWQPNRSFQPTKIEGKVGLDSQIDTVRAYLNKLTDKNYIDMRNKIIDILDKLIVENITADEMSRFSSIIFEIASTNRFYSKMYAELYSDLSSKYEMLMETFETNFRTFTDLFNVIEYVDPATNYDRFCENNKVNECRRSQSLFLVNLALNGFIRKLSVARILRQLLDTVMNTVNRSEKKNEIDELTENVAILFNKTIIEGAEDDSDYEEDELEISGNTIVETITLLAKSKVKDYKSLTNKAVFKYMDLVEM